MSVHHSNLFKRSGGGQARERERERERNGRYGAQDWTKKKQSYRRRRIREDKEAFFQTPLLRDLNPKIVLFAKSTVSKVSTDSPLNLMLQPVDS